MSEQIVQMGPMWVLAGLSAGWLLEVFVVRRGYGVVIDLGLGVGASIVGGAALLALSDRPPGMLGMFVVGFVLATGAILAQRLGWPCAPGARERRARLWLLEMGRPHLRAEGAGVGRPEPTHALARLATTGIYLLRGVPIEVQRAARVRAASEGTTLRQVLLRGVGEYAAGTWTPQPDDTRPTALDPRVHASGR